MESRQRLQENHAKADPLQRIQHAEPQPQGAADQGAAYGGKRPGDPLAHAGGAPEHLRPARGAEADGEDGQDPAVAAGGDGEAPEREGPDADEEGGDEQRDGPCGRVLAGPEVFPVAAVGGREEEVLDEDGDEEPEDYFAPDDGTVEGGDAAGGLSVVFRESEEEEDADGPHEEGDGDGDACEGGAVGY